MRRSVAIVCIAAVFIAVFLPAMVALCTPVAELYAVATSALVPQRPTTSDALCIRPTLIAQHASHRLPRAALLSARS